MTQTASARAPRNRKELVENVAIKAQEASITVALSGSAYRYLGVTLSYSSSRAHMFCDSREFRELLKRASDLSAAVVLDLNTLMRMSRLVSFEGIFAVLDASPIELLDTFTRTYWSTWIRPREWHLPARRE